MPNVPTSEKRRSKRVISRNRASLVTNVDRKPKRFPCLVLDSSNDGFRLRGIFPVKRGQTVEVILDEEPLRSVRCSVVWVGKPGSKQAGELGLEIN